MGDTADDFNALREFKREERRLRRASRSSEIEDLEFSGYDVEELTAYQFRIDDKLDIFPTNSRWHDLKSNTRGSFGRERLCDAVRRLIGPPEEQ